MGELDEFIKKYGSTANSAKKRRGWQQAGQLTVGGGQPVTMQYDFGEADTYTVGFLQPFANGNDPSVRGEALIMWNVGGSYKPVRVSMVGGMSVTAAAQGVKVIMSDATPTTQGGRYCATGTQYQVGCQVARGTRGFTQVPPYWIPQALSTPLTLSQSSPVVVEIVPDSGIQSVLVAATSQALGSIAPPVPGAITVEQFASSSSNLVGTPTLVNAYDPVINPMWFPIAPGCNGLKIFANTGQNASYNLQIIYGVDG